MAFHEIKVQEELAPNLVPMIDIMFLLLLFFMLNADMSQRDMAEIVPAVAKSAAEVKKEDNPDLILLNVFHDDPSEGSPTACEIYKQSATPGSTSLSQICRNDAHWGISLSGQKYTLTKPDLDRLKIALTELANTKRQIAGDKNSPSERSLMIRCDRTAPYGYVQRVYETAAQAMLYRIQVGAALPKEEVNRRAQEGK